MNIATRYKLGVLMIVIAVLATVGFLAADLFFSHPRTVYRPAANGGPPYCFAEELAAFTNGQAVLAALKSGDAQSRKQIQALIGSQALFDGSGVSPDGLKLKVSDNAILVIEIRPSGDVSPASVSWCAEVVGVLTSVDFEKGVIHVRARPEAWRIYASD